MTNVKHVQFFRNALIFRSKNGKGIANQIKQKTKPKRQTKPNQEGFSHDLQNGPQMNLSSKKRFRARENDSRHMMLNNDEFSLSVANGPKWMKRRLGCKYS